MSEMEFIDIFGDNLRDIIKEYGMTQRELAEAADLTEATISHYVNKKRMPTLKAIINICYVLNCPIDELVPSEDLITY